MSKETIFEKASRLSYHCRECRVMISWFNKGSVYSLCSCVQYDLVKVITYTCALQHQYIPDRSEDGVNKRYIHARIVYIYIEVAEVA